MTAGSVESTLFPTRAPVLVLGLGSLLLGDDAVGLRLLEELANEFRDEEASGEVEFADGGTLGLMLLGCISGRRAILILDAVGLDGQAAAGSIHCLRDEQVWRFRATRSRTAHEGNALELLETARLTGDEPASIAVIGVEPGVLRTGIGLSPAVEQAIPQALTCARGVLMNLVEECLAKAQGLQEHAK